MKKLRLLNLMTIIFLSSNTNGISQNIANVFYRSGFNNGGRITLYEDGTFIKTETATSCVMDNGLKTSKNELRGRYRIDNNKLLFSPEIQITKGYEDSIETTSLPDISKSSTFKLSYSIIEYDSVNFLFANQTENIATPSYYLRFQNHFLFIAYELNKTDSIAFPFREMWRDIKTSKRPVTFKKDIKEIFPEEYKDHILENPIEARVIEKKEVSFTNPYRERNPRLKKYEITFNKGWKQGIKPEMIFYPKGNNNYKCQVIIKNVFEQSCEGYTTNNKICNDIVNYSTKN